MVLVILPQQSLQSPSEIQSRVKLQNPTLYVRSCHKVLVTCPFFLVAPPQNNQSLEKSSCSRNPKTLKTQRTQRAIVRSLCSVSPIISSKSLSTLVSNPLLSIHCSQLSRLDFGMEDQPRIKQFC